MSLAALLAVIKISVNWWSLQNRNWARAWTGPADRLLRRARARVGLANVLSWPSSLVQLSVCLWLHVNHVYDLRRRASVNAQRSDLDAAHSRGYKLQGSHLQGVPNKVADDCVSKWEMSPLSPLFTCESTLLVIKKSKQLHYKCARGKTSRDVLSESTAMWRRRQRCHRSRTAVVAHPEHVDLLYILSSTKILTYCQKSHHFFSVHHQITQID